LRLTVLGDWHGLPDLIAQHHISRPVSASTRDVNRPVLGTLMDCLELGVGIVPMAVLYEQLTGRVPVEHIGDSWYVAMPIQDAGTGGLWPLMKRLMDVTLAGLGLLFLDLALPSIPIAIYLDSRGAIFHTQDRVGKEGRVLKAYKFRSMIPDPQEGKAVWAQKRDPRITRVGRLLRGMHIDEPPQFLNVLRGEMSVAGPRPGRLEFVERLSQEIPFYHVCHAVKPGSAGWGRVKQGYGASEEDALLKLQYDLYYIKHQSLWLDLVILLKTVLDALTLGGR
jgi:lipopolysaccharide/colanic/teichoic acid biosynthesis glycosyltransferase